MSDFLREGWETLPTKLGVPCQAQIDGDGQVKMVKASVLFYPEADMVDWAQS